MNDREKLIQRGNTDKANKPRKEGLQSSSGAAAGGRTTQGRSGVE